MFLRVLTLATGLAVVSAGTASAATMAFTEGNGQNRALVAGSVDLEDAKSGGSGFDLGTYDAGDVLGIYGRIVGSVDRFTFNVTSAFDLRFDFDGYALDDGGSVAAGLSGLVDQSFAVSGGAKGAAGGKGVTISLLDEFASVVGSETFVTNVTSSSLLDPVIFGNVGPGVYTLVVDGRTGPNKGRAALYDIEIAAKIPLPAAGWLLLGGLGAMAAMRRTPRG